MRQDIFEALELYYTLLHKGSSLILHIISLTKRSDNRAKNVKPLEVTQSLQPGNEKLERIHTPKMTCKVHSRSKVIYEPFQNDTERFERVHSV